MMQIDRRVVVVVAAAVVINVVVVVAMLQVAIARPTSKRVPVAL
jgi:hypothetical protein